MTAVNTMFHTPFPNLRHTPATPATTMAEGEGSATPATTPLKRGGGGGGSEGHPGTPATVPEAPRTPYGVEREATTSGSRRTR